MKCLIMVLLGLLTQTNSISVNRSITDSGGSISSARIDFSLSRALAAGGSTLQWGEPFITDGSYGVFDISDFGAQGNGVTDDTDAIQRAIDAALRVDGKVIIPPAVKFYKITSTLNIVPRPPDDQAWINIEGLGHPGFQIMYMGPSGAPAVKIAGIKGGLISGLRIRIAAGINNSACFDIGTSDIIDSTGQFTFQNCDATLGNGENNKGWRLGKIAGNGHADISQILWSNCSVWGGDGVKGQVGWENDGSNTLQLTWIGGGGSFCDRLIYVEAGGSQYFFGLGGSHNGTDFHIASSNSFGIYGGRFEVGKKFLFVPNASSHPAITISNVQLGDYRPPDGRVIEIHRTGSLIIDGVRLEGHVKLGAGMVYLGGTDGQGNLHVRGGSFQNVSDPFFKVETHGMWRVDVENVAILNSDNISASYFKNIRSLRGLPTSSSGLPSGTMWNNNGVISISK